jgi:hypothetical protein
MLWCQFRPAKVSATASQALLPALIRLWTGDAATTGFGALGASYVLRDFTISYTKGAGKECL